MATIRVRDWTKTRLEEIAERESHSSHDSVIKSLLKDREMAQLATQAGPIQQSEPEQKDEPSQGTIDGLSVLAELSQPENGVFFLWCPNCESEIAHFTVDSPIGIDVCEIECQHCLTQLDQHAIVAIEMSYPIEEKLVDGSVLPDLQTCVIDYWDRVLGEAAGWDRTNDDPDDLVWRIGQYAREFDWDWPDEIPAVSFESGVSYRNVQTNERIEVGEAVTNDRSGVNAYQVRRSPLDEDGEPEDEVLDSSVICEMILNRYLYAESEE